MNSSRQSQSKSPRKKPQDSSRAPLQSARAYDVGKRNSMYSTPINIKSCNFMNEKSINSYLHLISNNDNNIILEKAQIQRIMPRLLFKNNTKPKRLNKIEVNSNKVVLNALNSNSNRSCSPIADMTEGIKIN